TSNASSSATIDVLGLDGRIMTTRSWNVAPGAQRTSVDVSSLASGIYLVRLSAGSVQRTQRVVIR
ncbi:MAG: T9SS type A sorting domain-containing protein, partial [Flavobacteriales bacterium]|nr:T9SS type A sorting domain-containing protein [Flavobacteriales bacterium]